MVSAGNPPHQQTVEGHARQKDGWTAREKMTLRAALAQVEGGDSGRWKSDVRDGSSWRCQLSNRGSLAGGWGKDQCSDTGLFRENQLTGGTQQSLASS